MLFLMPNQQCQSTEGDVKALTLPAFDTHVGVTQSLRPLVAENWSPWAIMWQCFEDPMFSRFDTVLAYDRHTDRHVMTTYPALA